MTKTQFVDVASWELSDSLWERIEPLLPALNRAIAGVERHGATSAGVQPLADARS